MKKFVISLFLLLPVLVNAKTTSCSNEYYNATIETEKDKISLNETIKINIESDAKYDVNYKVKDAEIVSVDNDGNITSLKEGSTTVYLTIDFSYGEGETSTCNVDLPIEVVSNDSSLKSLTLEEVDISEVFQKDKYEYEVLLPYKYEKVNIIAEPSNPTSKISGDGRRYINEDNNEFNVVVTASDGTTSTYKIIIKRDSANEDTTLKDLIVEGYVLSPKFSKDVKKYHLSLGDDVDTITIKANPTYELAKVIGEGTFNIATGKNVYYINVTSESGLKDTYEIEIEKTLGLSKLTSLEIKNFKTEEKFSSDNYIYHLTINSDLDSLDIKALADKDDKVEVIGNEKLKYGENDIIIRVKGKDKSSTTYKIVVNKLSVEEEKKIEKTNHLLKILLIIFVISVMIMVSLIGLFIKKNFKKKKSVKY